MQICPADLLALVFESVIAASPASLVTSLQSECNLTQSTIKYEAGSALELQISPY
jgi:hypothetical protein